MRKRATRLARFVSLIEIKAEAAARGEVEFMFQTCDVHRVSRSLAHHKRARTMKAEGANHDIAVEPFRHYGRSAPLGPGAGSFDR
jgi:hypothetical protein